MPGLASRAGSRTRSAILSVILSGFARSGIRRERIAQRHVDALDPESLAQYRILEHTEAAFEVLADTCRFGHDPGDQSVASALGPDFDLAEMLGLQLHADLARAALNLKSNPFRDLADQGVRTRIDRRGAGMRRLGQGWASGCYLRET